MERKVDEMTKVLAVAFKDFILHVQFPANIDSRKIEIDKDSQFLNSNYTDTLEQYYGIAASKILYIHCKAKSKKNYHLVLGHSYTDTPADTPPPKYLKS